MVTRFAVGKLAIAKLPRRRLMRRAWKWIGAAGLFAALLAGGSAAIARAAQQDQAKKPSYTLAEYNAYQAVMAEKDPQNQVKQLDDLVQKYPSSELQDLLPFIDRAYYTDYYRLKNYSQVLVYVDKMLALGDQINAFDRLTALGVRAQVYPMASASDKSLQT